MISLHDTRDASSLLSQLGNFHFFQASLVDDDDAPTQATKHSLNNWQGHLLLCHSMVAVLQLQDMT
jgi:hypothetical protein